MSQLTGCEDGEPGAKIDNPRFPPSENFNGTALPAFIPFRIGTEYGKIDLSQVNTPPPGERHPRVAWPPGAGRWARSRNATPTTSTGCAVTPHARYRDAIDILLRSQRRK